MATLSFPSPTQLKNVSAPSDNLDAATKKYVDDTISTGTAGLSVPAGTNGSIQFFSNGSLSANNSLTFDSTTTTLTVSGNLTANTATLSSLTVTGLTNLGSLGNILISGGNIGQAIVTDGLGNLSFGSISAGAGGNTNAIQYNIDGVLTASDNFSYNPTSNTVNVIGNISLNSQSTLYFKDDIGNHVSFKAPANIAVSLDYILPNLGGNIGDVLYTDGTGNLGWKSTAGSVESKIDVKLRSGSLVTCPTSIKRRAVGYSVFTRSSGSITIATH
jgi:hypothetical protein